jgi:hypothetical protein
VRERVAEAFDAFADARLQSFGQFDGEEESPVSFIVGGHS